MSRRKIDPAASRRVRVTISDVPITTSFRAGDYNTNRMLSLTSMMAHFDPPIVIEVELREGESLLDAQKRALALAVVEINDALNTARAAATEVMAKRKEAKSGKASAEPHYEAVETV